MCLSTDRAVQTFFIDGLDPRDAIGAAKRSRKITSNTTFFKSGVCMGRTLVCVVKSSSASSTIKTLEPTDHGKGRKQPGIRKFLQGSHEHFRVYKEVSFCTFTLLQSLLIFALSSICRYQRTRSISSNRSSASAVRKASRSWTCKRSIRRVFWILQMRHWTSFNVARM